jgi:hypothetical protein
MPRSNRRALPYRIRHSSQVCATGCPIHGRKASATRPAPAADIGFVQVARSPAIGAHGATSPVSSLPRLRHLFRQFLPALVVRHAKDEARGALDECVRPVPPLPSSIYPRASCCASGRG